MSENSRKVEEQRESHTWGNTYAQETGTTLQEFKAVCAQSKSASETGFAIRGREKKKMAQNERLPTFHPETKIKERGRGGGKVFLRFTGFPISGSCRKQQLGARAPRPSRFSQPPSLCSPSSPASLCWGWEGRARPETWMKEEAAATGRNSWPNSPWVSQSLKVWRESGGITV